MNTEIKKTNISHNKIKNKIIEIDNKFKNKKFDQNKYFRYLKNIDKSAATKHCYCTLIMISNSFIPAILNTGYSLKHIAKVKYNTVCFVQDKPYYENNLLKFEGVNENDIKDIMKVYDIVIGIDILKLNFDKKDDKYQINYTNIIYYCTKSYIFGLTQYDKIIYLDASTYIKQSIDYLFDIYDISTYYLGIHTIGSIRGLFGNFMLIKSMDYYFDKLLYIINNYTKIFDNDYYSLFTYDEDVMYYAIYPYWNKNNINSDIFYNTYPVPNFQIEDKERRTYPVMTNALLKPFRYPLIKQKIERNFFINDCVNYKDWDDGVNLLIKKFPKFKKYFEYIKTYRYTNFIYTPMLG